MPERKRDLKLHRASGQWYETIDGKRHYLGKDYQAAKRRLAELVRQQKKDEQGGANDWARSPLVSLIDAYLDDCSTRCATTTIANYVHCLRRITEVLGGAILVGEVGKLHLSKVRSSLTGKTGDNTIRDTLAVAMQVFRWATNNDLIERNPLVGYRLPPRTGRTRLIADEEYQRLIEHSPPALRDIIVAVRETGCRPGELRKLVWDYVHLDVGLWIIPIHKTIGQQKQPRPRVVPLTPAVEAICRRLQETRQEPPKTVGSQRKPRKARTDPTAYVFRNTDGGSWTPNALVTAFRRARERAGIPDDVVLYSGRHTFATGGVGKVSDMEPAEILGHTNTATTRKYVHLSQDRLKRIREKLNE